MTSEYIPPDAFRLILMGLRYENALAVETSLKTGLRIDDVLNLKTEQLRRQRFTVNEQKTGKNRRIYIPRRLWERLLPIAGPVFVFSGRLDPKKHRTRQAVYKDLRRVATALGLKHVTPHSARKVYAVQEYHRSGDNLIYVRKLLQHSSESVTMLYAYADQIAAARSGSALRALQKRSL